MNPPSSCIAFQNMRERVMTGHPHRFSRFLADRINSKIPHHHGAPHIHGHDWLLSNPDAAARAPSVEHVEIRPHWYAYSGPRLQHTGFGGLASTANQQTVRKKVLFLEQKRGKK